jgi:hypothetical protein
VGGRTFSVVDVELIAEEFRARFREADPPGGSRGSGPRARTLAWALDLSRGLDDDLLLPEHDIYCLLGGLELGLVPFGSLAGGVNGCLYNVQIYPNRLPRVGELC